MSDAFSDGGLSPRAVVHLQQSLRAPVEALEAEVRAISARQAAMAARLDAIESDLKRAVSAAQDFWLDVGFSAAFENVPQQWAYVPGKSPAIFSGVFPPEKFGEEEEFRQWMKKEHELGTRLVIDRRQPLEMRIGVAAFAEGVAADSLRIAFDDRPGTLVWNKDAAILSAVVPPSVLPLLDFRLSCVDEPAGGNVVLAIRFIEVDTAV